MQKYDVAIIGAGISGIVAAQKLKQAGNNVLLLEKEPEVGGRLATSVTAEGTADFGAQFFTVRTKELQREVQGWLAKGWVRRWFGEDYPRYTSVDGMGSFASRLSEGLNPVTSTTITTIEDQDNDFVLYETDGKSYKSKRILFTMPAPQTVNLMDNSSVNLEASVYKTLTNLEFQPTYVGVFQFDQPAPIAENGHIDKQLPDDVERIVDHQKKGISNTSLVSVYMTADWSASHESEDTVLEVMKKKTSPYLDFQNLVSERLKTWSCAQAATTHANSFLNIDPQGKWLVAGDAFLRPDDQAGRTRFESAFLSGQDAAAHILSNIYYH
ncbi:NAD(P)/FAD-dependent oxidoreductase [Halobacillus naozhouensis]|uniref:FAD-dependent oxidoreductase n=1 Tax=Halobacillus naozhouensis TaxID=554880 RepID=A0ABY8IWF9_9BACI|nr:FAD-dependent oxidoreductase [Halobacillus naozhouensis]WFT74553.1 FAD-dependent oxidoreductase [Halobacillus naozhouensis]